MAVFSNLNAGQWAAICFESVCILFATTLRGVYKVKKRIEKNIAAPLAEIREPEQQSADNKNQEAQSITNTNNEIHRQKKEIVVPVRFILCQFVCVTNHKFMPIGFLVILSGHHYFRGTLYTHDKHRKNTSRIRESID